MKEELIEAFKSIIVIPLNMDKLNEDLDIQIKKEIEKASGSTFAPKLEPNEFFHINDTWCVIKDTTVLVDKECVGEVVENNMVNLAIYSEIRKPDGKRSWGIMPRFNGKQKLDEMLKDYALPETTLDLFMGDRFAYNGRVLNNMYEIYDEVKSKLNLV